MLANHSEYQCVWITKNKEVYKRLFSENKPVAMAYSLKGIRICLQASIAIVTNTIADFNQYCLNGVKEIWLWHGMPLKKIMMDDTFSGGTIRRKNYKIIKKITGFIHPWCDINPIKTITSARFFIPFLSSAFRLKENNILCTGLPRCDWLFRPHREKIIDNIREKYPGCTILFYMPTFRTAAWTGRVFNPFEGYEFDKEELNKVLCGSNTVFLYKPHFADSNIMLGIDYPRFIKIDDLDYDNLYCLLAQIDVLMTDYSSVYFDFLTLKKPILLAPFDYGEYIINARAHYFDYWTLMEGIKAKNWQDVMVIINEKKYYSVSNNTLERFVEYNTGQSCGKCYNFIRDY
jgi:CDP-glycerol glycerophosphotransferase